MSFSSSSHSPVSLLLSERTDKTPPFSPASIVGRIVFPIFALDRKLLRLLYENIIDKMNSLYPISDETIQILKENTVLCHFPKRHQLIEADKFCKSAYFIEEGMTRSFWLVNGEEITTSFACEGAIVFSMDELYYNKMSEEFVETLEDVVAYRISLTDLLRLFQTNIELANWGRVIHQNEYRRLHRSHKDRLTLSAKERYEAFKLQFPQMCQRIQLGYIASYLGITLSTLSRLRAYK